MVEDDTWHVMQKLWGVCSTSSHRVNFELFPLFDAPEVANRYMVYCKRKLGDL